MSSPLVCCVDIDAFFAQVAELEDPSLRGLPLAVLQHQDIICVNHLARSWGVAKHVPVPELRARWPSVVITHVPIVHGKASYTLYRSHSVRFWQALRDLLNGTGAVINKRGLDEGFFMVPAWEPARTEQHLRELQSQLLTATHLQVSIAASVNTLAAKMSMLHAKPAGVHVATLLDFQATLAASSIQRVPGSGRKVQQLYAEGSAGTVQEALELAQCEPAKYGLPGLQRLLGPTAGTHAWDALHGIAPSSIAPTAAPASVQSQQGLAPLVRPALDPDSTGVNMTLYPPWHGRGLCARLQVCLEEVLERLHEVASEHGLVPTSLVVTVQLCVNMHAARSCDGWTCAPTADEGHSLTAYSSSGDIALRCIIPKRSAGLDPAGYAGTTSCSMPWPAGKLDMAALLPIACQGCHGAISRGLHKLGWQVSAFPRAGWAQREPQGAHLRMAPVTVVKLNVCATKLVSANMPIARALLQAAPAARSMPTASPRTTPADACSVWDLATTQPESVAQWLRTNHWASRSS